MAREYEPDALVQRIFLLAAAGIAAVIAASTVVLLTGP